jgi:NTE family protein
MTRALVLGGGGVAGVAWEIGILAGLAESGVDVLNADLVIGTSAGSVVAAQVTSGRPLPTLLARQVDAAQQSTELTPTVDIAALVVKLGEIYTTTRDAADLRHKTGELALSVEAPEEARRAVIAGRLPVHEWPAGAVRLIAVDAHSGEPVVFDRESGVSLVDAVAASCAVPGVWPAVTIGDRRYMDGGMRSTENADLAEGYDQVLVLQVLELPGSAAPHGMGLADQVDGLRAAGSAVEVIRADEASTAAFTTNPLDPATRTPSALAGLAQGRAEADRIKTFWS